MTFLPVFHAVSWLCIFVVIQIFLSISWILCAPYAWAPCLVYFYSHGIWHRVWHMAQWDEGPVISKACGQYQKETVLVVWAQVPQWWGHSYLWQSQENRKSPQNWGQGKTDRMSDGYQEKKMKCLKTNCLVPTLAEGWPWCEGWLKGKWLPNIGVKNTNYFPLK